MLGPGLGGGESECNIEALIQLSRWCPGIVLPEGLGGGHQNVSGIAF